MILLQRKKKECSEHRSEALKKPIADRRMGGTSSDVLASAEFTRAEVTAGVVVTATLYLLV